MLYLGKGKYKLELLNFISQTYNWKQVIQEKPYCIIVKEDDKYILLSYSQIDSDFSLELVRECRGIILRKSDYKIVCFPFTKFFNIQETHASFINWNTARVQQKLDGSIIKVWFDDIWHISTNGTIDASQAELQNSLGDCTNYKELFLFCQNLSYDIFKTLNKNNTYCFELVSPWNRIVVPYDKTEIWHIGTRDNNTFEELNEDIGIQKPKEYPLYSAIQCLMAVQDLPFSEEGYVVVDNHFNRVKIKSPAYVAAHHLRGEGTLNNKRIVEMIKSNGQDDFLSIYPEYEDAFYNIQDKLEDFIDEVNSDWFDFQASGLLFQERMLPESRKNIALWITKKRCPPALFSLLDNHVSSVTEWIFKQQEEKILRWIGAE